ncbi:hypothetical protein HPB52_009360 [Rhipicephalus sanguineus]|uniref:Uncharacterized protein n=1 Tax=Rhipicephalus sanguineus TaxID=34632 RepID=A0A9D4QG79_RHISA|nr:hypothetical protein HPB52_009360 [Rhipicephalus sanguineus]
MSAVLSRRAAPCLYPSMLRASTTQGRRYRGRPPTSQRGKIIPLTAFSSVWCVKRLCVSTAADVGRLYRSMNDPLHPPVAQVHVVTIAGHRTAIVTDSLGWGDVPDAADVWMIFISAASCIERSPDSMVGFIERRSLWCGNSPGTRKKSRIRWA